MTTMTTTTMLSAAAFTRNTVRVVHGVSGIRYLSATTFGSNNNKKNRFIPRRRSSPHYRPLAAPVGTVKPDTTILEPSSSSSMMRNDNKDDDDSSMLLFGNDHVAAEALRYARSHKNNKQLDSSLFLRMADYMTARPGTTEHYVGERKALDLLLPDEDRETVLNEMDELIEEERIKGMELGEDDEMEPINKKDLDEEEDPNQLVHGDWAESVIQVDRVQKVQRGGTMVRYRALMIGGNGQGAAGFGVAKANSPSEATAAASRMGKRNIFFCDRLWNKGLTRDLVGKHNSCRVLLRATSPNYGLKGHDLVKEIMILMGITDCSCKTHGNRNPYNVVRATFKAILTHESMEEIALKRGKRLLNLERVKRLQI